MVGFQFPFGSMPAAVHRSGGTVYDLGEFQQRYINREHVMVRERSRRASSAVAEHLKTLVYLSWLSIHRSQAAGQREERSFESTVDKKLDQMSNELVKYFSLLIRRGETEQAKFQETVFLSLVTQQTPVNLFDVMVKLDLESEQNALVQIFEQFKLNQRDFSPHVATHFDTVKSAITAMREQKGFNTFQLSAVLAMARIHSLVQEWQRFGERQQAIYKPREDFLRILNSMVTRKTYQVNEKNELTTVLTGSDSVLPLPELSSGEKQLLIILGEALLQQKAAWIYIADEPELSLHVDWQVNLISNLRALNPQAQILFATHSPDIVSSYGDRVFSMEDILA